MVAKLYDRTMAALRRSPVILAAEKLAAEERQSRRTVLLDRIATTHEELKLREAALVSQAVPLERKLSSLRAEIEAIEAKLTPIAEARISAMRSSDAAIREFQSELRSDALEEVTEFKNRIEQTRDTAILHDFGARDEVLRGFHFDPCDPTRRFRSVNEKIKAAAALSLMAYNEADRIALEAVDVTGALERVREELLAAGIRLVGDQQ